MSIERLAEERKAAIAIFLCIIVILAWTNLFTPPPQVAKTTPEETSQSQVITKPQTTQVMQTSNPDLPAPVTASPELTPAPEAYEKAKAVIIDTPLVKAKISTLGGRLKSYELKKYTKEAGKDHNIDLIDADGEFLPLGITAGGYSDAAVVYNLTGTTAGIRANKNTYTIQSGKDVSLNFTGTLPDGNLITKTFQFNANQYLFNVNVTLQKPTADASSIQLEWNELLPAEFKTDRYNPKLFEYLSAEDHLEREAIKRQPFTYPAKTVRWIGIGDNYFAKNIVGNNTYLPTKFSVSLQQNNEVFAHIQAAGNSQNGNFKIYAGPKDPEILSNTGLELSRGIDLGWFAFIGQPILALIKFFYQLLGNYGLAIILVTLMIKLLLLPLTKTSFKSMKAMQDIQPQITALRERVKDPQALQQEMLRIYQQNGVNPMGGCLPMLLQIPVFLGMYNALRSSIYLRHADFALWINDLSSPERLMVGGVAVPVMILIMGASMFLQTALTPTTVDPKQKKIMYLMPVMFTFMFIIYPFPSGLVLYWLVNNVISIIQQYALRTERNIQPFSATIIAGVVVFGIGYFVTLL